MRKKMKGIVSASLVLGLILGTAMTSLTASAASSVGCDHSALKLVSSTTLQYTNADNFGHRKIALNKYECVFCGNQSECVVTIDEPHTINSTTHKCACGFMPPY